MSAVGGAPDRAGRTPSRPPDDPSSREAGERRCPSEVDLIDWLDEPALGAEHIGSCAACAGALGDLRRVRGLARALGARPRAPTHDRRRVWRAPGLAPRLASTCAALAVLALMTAEPVLRRRIDDDRDRASPSPPAVAEGTVFWTSLAGGALVAQVGR